MSEIFRGRPRRTLFAEGFPAKISPARARAQALLVSAVDCGLNLPGLSTRFGLSGSSSRTSPAGRTGGSTPFVASWDGFAMRRYRFLCRRRMSALLTSGGGCSLLPTPTSSDSSRGSMAYARGNPTLKGALFATPTARDYKGSPGKGTKGGRSLPRDLGQATRSLSPRFVEWMVGLPLGWSNVSETTGSKPSATSSSPSAPK